MSIKIICLFLLIIAKKFLTYHTSNSDSTTKSCFDYEEKHVVQLISIDLQHISVLEHLQRVTFITEEDICFEFTRSIVSGTLLGDHSQLVHHSPIPIDRTCLVPPPSPPGRSEVQFNGLMNTYSVIEFINHQTGKYRIDNGSLSSMGMRLEELSTNLYTIMTGDQCDYIDAVNIDENFFRDSYLLPQRPVVIRNFVNLDRVDIVAELSHHLLDRVGVKLSPSEDFEGVDLVKNWAMAATHSVPAQVLEQLVRPERVVVRAVHEEVTLGDFLSLLMSKAPPTNSTIAGSQDICDELHAYIEYLPLKSHLKGLNSTLLGDFVIPGVLDLFLGGEPYFWLGDGDTVGKFHFDPFDNILIQVEGSKTFALLDVSENAVMGEGHMREAILTVDDGRCRFAREKLLESTSMVHTPLLADEILNAGLPQLSCTVNAGDAIFVPSFWWHEVRSSPGASRAFQQRPIQLNAAVNFWFDPVWKKEFPCASCRKRFNQLYKHLLHNT